MEVSVAPGNERILIDPGESVTFFDIRHSLSGIKKSESSMTNWRIEGQIDFRHQVT